MAGCMPRFGVSLRTSELRRSAARWVPQTRQLLAYGVLQRGTAELLHQIAQPPQALCVGLAKSFPTPTTRRPIAPPALEPVRL